MFSTSIRISLSVTLVLVVLLVWRVAGIEAQERDGFWITSAAHDPGGTVTVELSGADSPLIASGELKATMGGTALGTGTRISDESTTAGLVVLLFETSSSMLFGKLESAQSAAIDFIDALGDGNQVAILAFDDDARRLSAPTRDRAATREAIESLTLGNNASLYDGVSEAVQLLESEAAASALVILGWGWEFSGVGVDRESSLTAASALGVPVFWTPFGADFDRAYFDQLTEATGGAIASPEELLAVADGLPSAPTSVIVEFQAPALPIGRHFLRVEGRDRTASTTVLISNEELLTITRVMHESPDGLFEIWLDTNIDADIFDIEARVSADLVPSARIQQGISVDPWNLRAGAHQLQVALLRGGELMASAEVELNVSELESKLTVERSVDRSLIGWRTQGEPGAELHVLSGGDLLATTAERELEVPIGKDADLEVRVVRATGEIIASRTYVSDPTVPPGKALVGSNRASNAIVQPAILGVLALAAGSIALVVIVRARRTPAAMAAPSDSRLEYQDESPVTTDPAGADGASTWPRRAVAVRLPDGRESHYPVRAPVITIGSGQNCDVRLPGSAARRWHVHLAAVSDYTYQVLPSAPVTLVETGERATADTVITVREWIAVGDHLVAVEHW